MGISNGTLVKRGRTWGWKYRLDGQTRWESLKVSSKHDAEVVRQQRIAEYHADRAKFSRADLNPPIDELRERYQHWARPHLRPKTIESTMWALGHFERLSGCKTIGAATPESINHLKTAMTRNGLSNVSVNNALRTLKAFVNHTRKNQWYSGENPFVGVKPLPQPKKKPRWLSGEQIRAVLDAAEGHSRDVHLFFALGIYAGLRRNEIVNCRWEWLDFNGKYIHVQGSKTFHIKDHEERTVPLHDRLREILKAQTAESGYILAPGKEPTSYRYRYEPNTSFSTVCETAGVPWVTAHILRHTFASQLASAGVSLAKVGTWLGHADLKTTQIYAHLSPHDEDINAF